MSRLEKDKKIKESIIKDSNFFLDLRQKKMALQLQI